MEHNRWYRESSSSYHLRFSEHVRHGSHVAYCYSGFYVATLLFWRLGCSVFRDAKDYLYSHVLSAFLVQSDPDREKELRKLNSASPPLTDTSTLKFTLPRSKPSLKTRQQKILNSLHQEKCVLNAHIMIPICWVSHPLMLTQFLSSQAVKHLPLVAKTQGWNPCLSTVSAFCSIHCHTRVGLGGKLHNYLQRSIVAGSLNNNLIIVM